MRLDHLLSRERREAKSFSDPRSNMVGEGKRARIERESSVERTPSMKEAGTTGKERSESEARRAKAQRKAAPEGEAEGSQLRLAFKEAEMLRSFSLYRFEDSRKRIGGGQGPKPIRMGIFIRILKTAQEKEETRTISSVPTSTVLGGLEQSRQDQANKSAGWMPWH